MLEGSKAKEEEEEVADEGEETRVVAVPTRNPPLKVVKKPSPVSVATEFVTFVDRQLVRSLG